MARPMRLVEAANREAEAANREAEVASREAEAIVLSASLREVAWRGNG